MRLNSCVRAFCAVVLSGGLAACATQAVEPNRDAIANVQTIVQHGPNDPDDYHMDNADMRATMMAGGMFGALGAIAAYSMAGSEARGEDANAALDLVEVDVSGAFSEELSRLLSEGGYELTSVEAPEGYRSLDVDHEEIGTDADAILDVSIFQEGYSDLELSEGIAPWVRMDVSLISSADGETLFSQPYLCAGISPSIGINSRAQWIPSDPEYTFPDLAGIAADPTRAAEGMHACGAEIARAVALVLVP